MKAEKSLKTISLKDAAERIGLAVPKLRRLIKRGEGPPFITLGRDITFRETSIDAWLASCEQQSKQILKRNRALVRKFTGTPKAALREIKLESK